MPIRVQITASFCNYAPIIMILSCLALFIFIFIFGHQFYAFLNYSYLFYCLLLDRDSRLGGNCDSVAW